MRSVARPVAVTLAVAISLALSGTAAAADPSVPARVVVHAVFDEAAQPALVRSTVTQATGAVEASPDEIAAAGPRRLVAGGAHVCTLVAGGAARCWGFNGYGQLGDASISDRHVPVTVVGLSSATAMAAGYTHTCAVVAGLVQCWGSNFAGQLGNGTTTDSLTPVTVAGVSGAVDVAAGAEHSCAIVSGGAVKCWGSNQEGELGDPALTAGSSATSVDVATISGATALAAGNWTSHTCALLAGGAVKCWGDNTHGQLGNGTTTGSATPVNAIGISGATIVAAGGDHSCALVAGGNVWCWGDNAYGELGNGSTADSATPVQAAGVAGATDLVAGDSYTCVLLGAAGAKCWGANNRAQFGNGTAQSAVTVPLDVSAWRGASALSAGGSSHTCGAFAGGTVKCAGFNYNGQLGDGTTATRFLPVAVIGLGDTIFHNAFE